MEIEFSYKKVCPVYTGSSDKDPYKSHWGNGFGYGIHHYYAIKCNTFISQSKAYDFLFHKILQISHI